MFKSCFDAYNHFRITKIGTIISTEQNQKQGELGKTVYLTLDDKEEPDIF